MNDGRGRLDDTSKKRKEKFSPLTWRRRVPRHTIVPLHNKWNLMWFQHCLIFRTFRFIILKLSFLWDTKKAITSSSNFGSVFFLILIVVFVCSVCIKVCGLPFSSTAKSSQFPLNTSRPRRRCVCSDSSCRPVRGRWKCQICVCWSQFKADEVGEREER